MSELRRELRRKAFHALCLGYWAAFAFFGWPRAGRLLAAWLIAALAVESARLRIPAVERRLLAWFGGVIRQTELRRFSGVPYAAGGSLAAMLIARGDPVVVGAAIGQLALGDAAAALAGKAFGKTKILGGRKSLEGGLAGLAVCHAVAVLAGARPGAAAASAAAATAVELLSTDGFFNDNFWMPVASALVLKLLS